MDVDPMHKKLTDTERARLRLEGACFRCRRPGHLSRHCPLNQTSQASITTIEDTDEDQSKKE